MQVILTSNLSNFELKPTAKPNPVCKYPTVLQLIETLFDYCLNWIWNWGNQKAIFNKPASNNTCFDSTLSTNDDVQLFSCLLDFMYRKCDVRTHWHYRKCPIHLRAAIDFFFVVFVSSDKTPPSTRCALTLGLFLQHKVC